MKKTLWNLLLTLPIFAVLLILTSSIKTLANQERTLLPLSKVDTSESAELININPKLVQATPQPVNQSSVTSVSELSDVQPTDWAFQALQSLVERYGCIVGYPDSTYRKNRALTRYEFAAGLNACLGQIRQLIASSTAELSSKEDLATLERLTEQFRAELVSLRGKIDNLEVRTAKVEAEQFSTTTKLIGNAVFVVADTFGNRANNTPADDTSDNTNTFFSYRSQLSLQTSFTGRDQLVTSLQAMNIPNLAATTGTHMTRFTLDAGKFEDDEVYLSALYYTFPVGDKATVWIGTRTLNFPVYVPTLNPINGSALQGGFSRFGAFNPTVYRPGFDGAGAAIAYKFSNQLQLHAAYISDDTQANSPDSGLFDSSFAAIAQLTFTPSNQFNLGLTYTRKYFTANSGLNLTGGTGSAFARNPFLQNATTSDNYGLQFNWRVNPRFHVGGWFGYTLANQEGDDNSNATIINSALNLSFPDLFKEGNVGGITLGIPPKVTSNNFQVAGQNREDPDTSLHIETFYRFRVNDNISITPIFYLITKPEHNDANDSIWVGVLRTSLAF
ncbi:iron uptake porin [Nostoc sp. FACHB-888]|uniref:iron uptake porin n=1 Tax=Nostoc sp. FACHB-888 TaxID=2692842 RepID=UPI001687BA64|nr:iron uptake porin [Nostoc sp. FACHB-888]MBD2245704.1 carbohydrate porin [Nostoc sp. FACHB-888]MCC5652001.1 iron uptake porin [Nostoc sp. XA013]